MADRSHDVRELGGTAAIETLGDDRRFAAKERDQQYDRRDSGGAARIVGETGGADAQRYQHRQRVVIEPRPEDEQAEHRRRQPGEQPSANPPPVAAQERQDRGGEKR